MSAGSRSVRRVKWPVPSFSRISGGASVQASQRLPTYRSTLPSPLTSAAVAEWLKPDSGGKLPEASTSLPCGVESASAFAWPGNGGAS